MNNVQSTRKGSVKKAYQQPQLKTLGSVKELTLKLGSVSDGMGGHLE